MWSHQTEPLADDRGQRVVFHCDSRPATFAEVAESLREDAACRERLISVLADADFSAYRWETPPVTADTKNQPFEFVLIDDPWLDRAADPSAFADHLKLSASSIAVFPNLGRDAILVVPCPIVDHAAYGHLAAFSRSAPSDQQHALWRAVGEAMAERLSDRPVWLSTAGGGVPWLHVRLDDRPKYYAWAEYRDRPP